LYFTHGNSCGIKKVSKEDAYQKMVDHVPACMKMAEACQVSVVACEYAYTYCNLVETTGSTGTAALRM
jgi:ribulose kinase